MTRAKPPTVEKISETPGVATQWRVTMPSTLSKQGGTWLATTYPNSDSVFVRTAVHGRQTKNQRVVDAVRTHIAANKANRGKDVEQRTISADREVLTAVGRDLDAIVGEMLRAGRTDSELRKMLGSWSERGDVLAQIAFAAVAGGRSHGKTIYDQRTSIDEAARNAGPRLYVALKNLLNAVEERRDCMGIESVTINEAHGALLAATGKT